VKNVIARHETTAFLLLTFGISWPLWMLSGALERDLIRTPDLRWLVAQIGVFAPSFAAMIVAACAEPGAGRPGLRTLAAAYIPAAVLGLLIATRGYDSFFRIGTVWSCLMAVLGIHVLCWFARRTNRMVPWPAPSASAGTVARWSAAAVLFPTAAFLLAWWLTRGTPHAASAAVSHGAPARDVTTLGLLNAVFFNLLFGGSLGEEPGWRGAWLPRLLRKHTPFEASLIVSFWWALWHAPIDITHGFGLPGLGSLVVRQCWTLPVAILFTWVTLRAGGNLVAPIALHTTLNAFTDFVMGDPAHYSRAIGLFFLLTAAAAVAALFIDPRSWKGRMVTTGISEDAGPHVPT
jgi:membrane protease YdiL (CAAX protease family)